MVQRFQGTIEKVAALAVLMPIVSSMGGIAGTQTVTLIIRGLALGQVQWRDARWLLLREVGISALTGTAMALIVGAITIAWLGTWTIAPIIGAAMLINLLAAAVVGVMVPLIAAAAVHRPGAVGRRDPDHVHRLHRLRDAAGPGRAVPDLVDRAGSSCRHVVTARASASR